MAETYTSIPDTSDLNYWILKGSSTKDRSNTFVPRDKELHKRLKAEAWVVIQSRLERRQRAKPSY